MVGFFWFEGGAAGAVDELSVVFAEPAGSAVFDDFLPAATVIDNEKAATGHGFEADAWQVLEGVGGQDHSLAVLVEVLLRHLVGADGSDVAWWIADLLLGTGVPAQDQAFLQDWGGHGFVDPHLTVVVFVSVGPRDATEAKFVVWA